jgi:hypothetical protein
MQVLVLVLLLLLLPMYREANMSKHGKSRSPARQHWNWMLTRWIFGSRHICYWERLDVHGMSQLPVVTAVFCTRAAAAQRSATVSSLDYFVRLLEDWMHDPCGDNATATAGARIVDAFAKEQARHY